MKSKNSSSKSKFRLSILCTLIFIISVGTLFVVYQRSLNTQFKHMETENLTAHALTQSQYISTLLADLQGRMSAAAKVLSSPAVNPEGKWATEYLEQLCETSEYSVRYVTAEECYDMAASPAALAEDINIYKKLISGESAISSIHYSTKLNDYYFALDHPVQKDGQTIGILRCIVRAELLLTPIPTSSFYENSAQCIVDSDGNILYGDFIQNWMGVNFLEALAEKNVSAASLDSLKPALKADFNTTVKLRINHTSYFCSSVSLGYSDWNLVQIYKTSAVDEVLQKILKNTIAVSLAVIFLTVLIAMLVFRVIIKQHKKIQLEEARYTALSNFTDTILFEYDVKSDQMELTPNATQLLALEKTTIENFMSHNFQALYSDDLLPLKKMMASCMNSTSQQSLEIRLLQKNGQWVWCECLVQPVAAEDTVVKLMGKLSDISSRKARELRLLKQTKTDPLTDLLNLDGIRSSVDQELAEKKNGFLFMMDIDNFKSVNDTYGHDIGDQILREVGSLLHQSFREYDPVGRIGGDEFIAFLGDTCSRDIACMKGELIIQRFSELKLDGIPRISISVGIAACPACGTSYDALYKAADKAMYEAKSRGKNQFYFYECE
ncbi:diguanylate cyclase [Ruminococcus sp. OA3]|uniref:diguanylate cyclase domain-containing protein n=1 Tax=Ruminococcus sp. OA3 TaxID=2914164 RepID=UPI001F0523DC|nr:diguanylate cyclase [Ruminococcus sp. OA3]MCH1981636.1 diguanylate cyclase [Ruminococcus sp. OA3]